MGTHIAGSTKVVLQALAESRNQTMYALIQDLLEDAAKDFNKELVDLDESVTDEDGSDLLE